VKEVIDKIALKTIASNLIILRKALGTDIAHALTEERMSELQFGSRGQMPSTGTVLSSVRSPISVSAVSRSQNGRGRRDTVITVYSQSVSDVDVAVERKKSPGLAKEEV
jgi:hypothetical protein